MVSIFCSARDDLLFRDGVPLSLFQSRAPAPLSLFRYDHAQFYIHHTYQKLNPIHHQIHCNFMLRLFSSLPPSIGISVDSLPSAASTPIGAQICSIDGL